MARHSFAATPRSSAPAPRTPAHLVQRWAFRLTPELCAGLALIGLVAVNLFGFYAVLFFFAATAGTAALNPVFTAREVVRFSPLLLLPALAILSTMWSDAPQSSMRAGLQLLATAGAAVVICRNLRPERAILAMFASFLALGLLIATYIPGAIASGFPLAAWLGSKNQVGFVAYMVVALALALICDRNQPTPARLAALAAIPFALMLAWLSQSGGTTASIALTLLVFPPLALLVALKPSMRVAVSLLTLCLVIAATFFLADIEAGIADFRQNVLGKDATLTGRTYLWDVADRLSAARPTWGYGYAAFWRQGNIDAEGLWRWGGIASRSGFNFHNVFVAMRVDLGLVGMYLLIATCAGVAVVAVARQLLTPSMPMACLLGITVVNYFRALVEEGLVAPFSFVTLIWLATALYAFRPSRAVDPAGSARDAPAPPRRASFGGRPRMWKPERSLH